MKVKDVMIRLFITVDRNEKLRKVNEIFQRYHSEFVLIVSQQGKLEGIVTYHELFRKILPSYDEVMRERHIRLGMEEVEEKIAKLVNEPVSSVMVKNVVTVSPDMPIVEAGALMQAKKIRQLPVVEHGKVVGVLRFRDIMWGFLLKSYKYV